MLFSGFLHYKNEKIPGASHKCPSAGLTWDRKREKQYGHVCKNTVIHLPVSEGGGIVISDLHREMRGGVYRVGGTGGAGYLSSRRE